MAVSDRWQKSRPAPGEPECEHEKVPAAEHGEGDRWQVRWRGIDGRQRKQNFGRRPDADRFDTKVRTELDTGSDVDPRSGKVTFRVFAEQWLRSQTTDVTTAHQIGMRLRKHVYPYLSDKQIGLPGARRVQHRSRASRLSLRRGRSVASCPGCRRCSTRPPRTASSPVTRARPGRCVSRSPSVSAWRRGTWRSCGRFIPACLSATAPWGICRPGAGTGKARCSGSPPMTSASRPGWCGSCGRSRSCRAWTAGPGCWRSRHPKVARCETCRCRRAWRLRAGRT